MESYSCFLLQSKRGSVLRQLTGAQKDPWLFAALDRMDCSRMAKSADEKQHDVDSPSSYQHGPRGPCQKGKTFTQQVMTES